jgi:Ni/Co efflux regulator RcnB
MGNRQKIGTAFLCALLGVAATAATAEPPGHDHEPAAHGAPHGEAHGAPHGAPQGEAHRGPSGYHRVAPPKGWDARPTTVDRGSYQHNFRAARSFHVGPYHQPAGWVAHTWHYGDILPRPYWASQYILADYWLFALEVPPAGYEWVRDGSDALLVSVDSGEILQVEYGVFG